MTEKDRELALYCLKANSDYHSEVCEECVNYPNCDHTIQDDVTETIIKALEQEPCDDCVRRQDVLDILKDKWGMFSDANDAMQESIDTIRALKPVTPQSKTDVLDKIRAEIKQLDYNLESVDYDHNDMAMTEEVHMICQEEVLQIIDKYKSESEE